MGCWGRAKKWLKMIGLVLCGLFFLYFMFLADWIQGFSGFAPALRGLQIGRAVLFFSLAALSLFPIIHVLAKRRSPTKTLQKSRLIAAYLGAWALFGAVYWGLVNIPRPPVTGPDSFTSLHGNCGRSLYSMWLMAHGPALSRYAAYMFEDTCRSKKLYETLQSDPALICGANKGFACFKGPVAEIMRKQPFGVTGHVLMMLQGVIWARKGVTDKKNWPPEPLLNVIEVSLISMEGLQANESELIAAGLDETDPATEETTAVQMARHIRNKMLGESDVKIKRLFFALEQSLNKTRDAEKRLYLAKRAELLSRFELFSDRHKADSEKAAQVPQTKLYRWAQGVID